jgi:NDP-sugar pyrophosphorylase family protein
MRRERITITIRQDALSKIDSIIDNKKIRNRSNAIETIVLEKFQNSLIEKAVILGSGHGIMFDGKLISKVLLPIGEETLLEHNIKKLRSFGVKEITLAAGKWEKDTENSKKTISHELTLAPEKWKKDIEEIIGNGEKLGVKINYYEKADGTAGVLKHLQGTAKEAFIMINGDILLEDIDFEDMYYAHRKNDCLATIAVATVSDPKTLGSIHMKGNLIVNFQEKAKEKENQSLLINSGIYILEPDVCKLVTEDFSMVEHDVFPILAKDKELYGYQVGKNWIHLHDEDAYKEYLKKVEGVK